MALPVPLESMNNTRTPARYLGSVAATVCNLRKCFSCGGDTPAIGCVRIRISSTLTPGRQIFGTHNSPLEAVEEGVEFGGGLGLQALQRVYLRLQRVSV